jgi:hypothetical protein
MTKARFDGLLLLILGSTIFVLLGLVGERISPVSMVDFKELYYGSQCLLQHSDPYQESQLLRVYQGERADRLPVAGLLLRVVTLYINLPTTLLLTSPFAMLPWEPAHLLWMTLTASIFILAAYLMWNLGGSYAPRIPGLLICLLLISSELLLEIGNAAGITISLCAIAVWCFLKGRFVPAGILCFSLSIALKPHDVGFVWLYFLLAGGLYRKRALQTLALTIVLSLPAILWVSHVAPHWVQELHSNLQTISMHGGMSDPGPAGVEPKFHGAVSISLQTIFSVFWDNPRIYNPATYLVCAPLLLVWMLATLRSRSSQAKAWLALAAIAALSMLPVYHRQHDSRLLLLTFPACAMLWAEGGAIGWLALLVNAAGVVFTGDTPLLILGNLAVWLHASTTSLPGKLLTVLFARPAPIVLLIIGIFYLWVYVRRTAPNTSRSLTLRSHSPSHSMKQTANRVASRENRSA